MFSIEMLSLMLIVWISGLLANRLRQEHFRKDTEHALERHKRLYPELDGVISPPRLVAGRKTQKKTHSPSDASHC